MRRRQASGNQLQGLQGESGLSEIRQALPRARSRKSRKIQVQSSLWPWIHGNLNLTLTSTSAFLADDQTNEMHWKHLEKVPVNGRCEMYQGQAVISINVKSTF